MRSRYILALVFLLNGTVLSAQDSAQRPTAVATRLTAEERIEVDGVLDEAAWERAEPVADFTQSEPRNGERETERTEIRILFNADNLYIGAQFFDSDPDGL